MENINKKNLWPMASLAICAALYLIWPLAHTIALRKVLLVLGSVVALVLWFRSEDRQSILKSPWFVAFNLLLVWVLWHAGFVSQNGNEAWSEFVGQWIPVYLAALSGIGLAIASRSINRTAFEIYLLAVAAAQPVAYLVVSLFKVIKYGYLVAGFMVPNGVLLGTDLKTSLTFSSDMLAAFACARLYLAYGYGVPDSKKYLWVLLIALAMYVAAFSSTLNSMLLISGFIVLAILMIGKRRCRNFIRNLMIGAIALVISVIVLVNYSDSAANKWVHMQSNLGVAMNIDGYRNWVNYGESGLPENEFGEKLPESFYLRVAWAKAGIQTLYEHPWGYGVTRHAFERLIQQKYPEANISSAHNGYLNLGCAVGIPGIMLFVSVIFLACRQIYRSGTKWSSPATWAIALYAIHWMLDAIERDHFFESYLFVIALLSTLTVIRTTTQNVRQ